MCVCVGVLGSGSWVWVWPHRMGMCMCYGFVCTVFYHSDEEHKEHLHIVFEDLGKDNINCHLKDE